jgi:hypothetical protein
MTRMMRMSDDEDDQDDEYDEYGEDDEDTERGRKWKEDRVGCNCARDLPQNRVPISRSHPPLKSHRPPLRVCQDLA